MSNRKCCVPECLNSLDTNANLHTFPNPAKDKQLFNTWVYSVGGDILQLENEHIFKYRRVCGVHFEQKYCCRNNRLSIDAVPTRNMPGLSSVKFHSESTVLKPHQTSEASTSKEHCRQLHLTIGTRRRVKRIALNQSEHDACRINTLVGVKLSATTMSKIRQN